MNWLYCIVMVFSIFALGAGLDTHLGQTRKNQEKIIEQNEQIIELLKTNNNDKEIQFVQ